MEGGRIEDLKTSLRDLAGADTSSQGTFARFRNREKVTLIPFDTAPQTPTTFEVPESGGSDVLQQISQAADGLIADGDTAIYDSMIEAYRVAQKQVAANPDAYTSIVLMTDGEWTYGADSGDFLDFYANLPDDVRAVPTFTILFGDSSVDEMQQIADATGGRVFDARDGELSQAFQEIRGYQ
jgi:Ca-activated chloride channel family protein